MSTVNDGQFLLLHADDNILVCTRPVASGGSLTIDGIDYPLTQELALGHKVARRALATGDLIVKYGAVIGVATRPIGPAEHVHVHNIASRYTRTHLIEDSP